jgi:aminotransferase in exopolysaccharide biosynthesis
MSDRSIPLSVPSIQGNEWRYVKECLDTEWVSSAGKYVNTFEEKICEYTGARHAVAVVNGTAALHISLIVAGVVPGDEVIVPTLTFIAPVNTVIYAGAKPVFMDCDEYYNIDAGKTIEFIRERTEFRDGYSYNTDSGRRISAIIPVHIFGNAVKMEDLAGVCQERNIKIIEDATESLGTFYSGGAFAGRHTGAVGDFGCYSFNGNKIITTGGGGMIVTDNDEYAERSRYLSTQAKNDPVRYVHNETGYNYRLTNIQAAVGVAQLEKLPEFIEKKKKNYAVYKEAIDRIDGLHLAGVPDYAEQNHWFYSLQIDKDRYGRDRDGLMNYLAEKNIQARPVWELNHRQNMYKNDLAYKIEKAYELWEISLNIPCSVNLDRDSISRVIKSLQ